MKRLSTEHIVHVMSKNNVPAITITSGETLIVETAKPGISDEVFEKDYSQTPFPKRILSITGPVYIEDAMPTDVLKVEILDIALDTMGKMWMGQWMGLLMDEVDHCYMKKVAVHDGQVFFDEKLQFPIKPMIGTIGVAPLLEDVDCLYPGIHGGNMDAPNVTIGSSIYLPVQVAGALVCVGDVHAAMGYGEIFGTGIEIGSTLTLKISVIKDFKLLIKHPMIESPAHFEILVSASNLLEACKEAVRNAIAFIMCKTDYSYDDAYALAGQACDLKILQVVNPDITVSMSIPKAILRY